MPQKTNLNVSPYYDDFGIDKDFYRVLFKPGFPIQSRELNNIQSILQNQIEQFGNHIFKDGSVVIPGAASFDNQYYAVKIDPIHLGIDVSVYIDNFIGKTIKGQTTQVTATVVNILSASESDENQLTIYVKYKESGDALSVASFQDGEILIAQEDVVYGNTTITGGSTFAQCVASDATAIGCAAHIDAGIYFVRGIFAQVAKQTLILDQYTNQPEYRVGLDVIETIVTAKDDATLYDNARGFSNFAAPGADRFSIELRLSKKSISDRDDKTFVEILRLTEGRVEKIGLKTQYNLIRDYFAERTYDESGDYSVEAFDIGLRDSLNDRQGNSGLFYDNQTTYSGNNPSDDLASLTIGPGKAYVRGFDIENFGTKVIDVEKPRDTKASSTAVPFNMGNILKINHVIGQPVISLNTSQVLNLYNTRKTSTVASAAPTDGTLIGQARVYALNADEQNYVGNETVFNLHLFDVQTYTQITLNVAGDSVTIPATSFIEGLSSGATGYTVNAATTDRTLSLTEVTGNFQEGENIRINGLTVNPRSIINIRTFTTADIHSVYQDTSAVSGYSVDFSADVAMTPAGPLPGFGLGETVIFSNNGATGVTTVRAPGKTFTGIATDTIVRYTDDNKTQQTFARVTDVTTNGLVLSLVGVLTVGNICDGGLPVSGASFELERLLPQFTNPEDAYLFAPIGKPNVASVDLGNSQLAVNHQFTGESTDGSGNMEIDVSASGITSAFFEVYDPDRYVVSYSGGTQAPLTAGQFTLTNDSTTLTISGLDASESNVVVNATLKKRGLKSKIKNLVKSQKTFVRLSKFESAGITTGVNNGLTYNKFNGLRVEDEEISLNTPDVINVVAVHQSKGSADPSFDSLVFQTGLNLDTNSVLGEYLLGGTSGALAQLVTRSSATTVEFVYLNSTTFQVNEDVKFLESNITGTIQTVNLGSYIDLTDKYSLDTGNRQQFCDFSRIKRKTGRPPANKRMVIVYDKYNVPSVDTGDIFTVQSYQASQFKDGVPSSEYFDRQTGQFRQIRLTDTLDFRPRVTDFAVTTSSPFAFTNRAFDGTGNTTTLVPKSGETSIVDYEYYQGRNDLLALGKDGSFQVIKGAPSDSPRTPTNAEEAMNIATIEYPPYLYDVTDAKITEIDNKRYTMRDIGDLDDRLTNLELTTSLSLLELDTSSFQVIDAQGLSRFKSGFFADDFKNQDFIDYGMEDTRITIDEGLQHLIVEQDTVTIPVQVATASTAADSLIDYSADVDLLDSNVVKKGNRVQLAYTEETYIEQPLATRVENVNPFNLIEWVGAITLTPAIDSWVTTIRRSGGNRMIPNPGRRGQSFSSTSVSQVGDPWIRSRNVKNHTTGFKPFTRYYHFLDGVGGIDWIPKLIEVTPVSGTFVVGETVDGFDSTGNRTISFRVAQQNHKEGPFNNPTRKYQVSPYDRTLLMSALDSYNSSSVLLNVDIDALAAQAGGSYSGFITPGGRLIGRTSQAQATIDDSRLVTDNWGTVIGSFFFRNPNSTPAPALRFPTGTKTYKMTSSSTNAEPLPGSLLISSTETTYRATGIIRTITTSTVTFYDPLAQSFTTDSTGGYITSVDIFMGNKDTASPLEIQLRTMELGTPTTTLVSDDSKITLEPDQINTSRTADVPTRVTFPSPVFLEPNTEYAIVLLCPSSDQYEAWVARMGEKTVNTTTLPNVEGVIYARQYGAGSLFKSQNGSIWTASQYEDMAFRVYRAKFTSQRGTVFFYNPIIDQESNIIEGLQNNSVTTLPRKLTVGITTIEDSAINNILRIGQKVGTAGVSTDITGFIEQFGGPIQTLSVSGVGTNYADGTYNNVTLISESGGGTGATASIVVSNGQVSGATVSAAATGNGYVVGDTVAITTSLVGGRGSGGQVTISAIYNSDTIYATNVQGEQFTVDNNLLWFPDSGEVGVAMTSILVRTSTLTSSLNEGNIFEVDSDSHGNVTSANHVSIRGLQPDSTPVKLQSDLSVSATAISVASTATFTEFEGLTTFRGFLKVGSEIIYYDSIGDGTLGIATRGVDNTTVQTHTAGADIYKYELNGISLTRINTDHKMPTDAGLQGLKTFDKYYLEVNRPAGRQTGENQLSFTDDKTAGGNGSWASKNIQFSSMVPNMVFTTPGDGTSINATVRTTSGTSQSGTEASFVDKGFEPIQLNDVNFFPDPRIVAGRVNETTYLAELPKNRSFTLALNLESINPYYSPQVRTDITSIVFQRNRIDAPVGEYTTDGRVNSVTNDPHASVYIGPRVELDNPATSIKVLAGVNKPAGSDIRVLYRLFRTDSGETDPTFELFPGFSFANTSVPDGTSDTRIAPSFGDEFLEHVYTADNLDKFNAFQIKIDFSGTNESTPPSLQDLRVIALA